MENRQVSVPSFPIGLVASDGSVPGGLMPGIVSRHPLGLPAAGIHDRHEADSVRREVLRHALNP